MNARRRAMGEDEKLARRRSILDAAQTLYLQHPRELPSVSQIAQACGLAKGTFYLYFRTKEAVFLALLGEQFTALFDMVTELLQEDGLCSPEVLVDRFLQRYVAYLKAHPAFLRLAVMANSVIEPNVDETEVLAFKSTLANRLTVAGGLFDRHLPVCFQGNGTLLLLRIYALTIGLWQMLDLPDNIASHIRSDRTFDVLQPDFFVELPAALGQLLASAGAANTRAL